ncbi:MAG: hypothetical protein GXP25_08530 [Planctomycetes bacterium]|nr:hypothetical protein [Planctomycetota bacterium]
MIAGGNTARTETQARHVDVTGGIADTELSVMGFSSWSLSKAGKNAAKKGTRMRQMRRRSEEKDRECIFLGCERMFWSSWPGERVCPQCRKLFEIARPRYGEIGKSAKAPETGLDPELAEFAERLLEMRK